MMNTSTIFKAFMEHTSAVIYFKYLDGTYVNINNKFLSTFNFKRSDVIGKKDYDIFQKIFADAFTKNDKKVADSGLTMEFDEQVQQGEDIHDYISIKFPVFEKDNSLCGTGGISTNITLRKAYEKELSAVNQMLNKKMAEITILQDKINKQVNKDPLTGAFNRRYFNEAFERELHWSENNNKVISFAYIDLDYFKKLNDKKGHHAGDNALKIFSLAVNESINSRDLFVRYGGDEFVLMLPYKTAGRVKFLLDKIRALYKEYAIATLQSDCSFSAGISEYPTHSKNKGEIIKFADDALYHAKYSGKNRTIIWSSKISK